MNLKLSQTTLFVFLISCFGYAFSSDKPTDAGDKSSEQMRSSENNATTLSDALTGDAEAGKTRYNRTCTACHGTAGKGVASYPKVSGNDISYTISKLENYRDGIKVGPNSSLMIMMAKPLTDEEIVNLATYLKDATP